MMLKKLIVTSVSAGILLLLPACWKNREQTEESSRQLYVLNVLDPEQYNECHIPGSINVPHEKVAEYVQNIDKNAEVVVYCANYQCSGSWQVAKQLTELGFENVHAYEGGIAEWYQQGLPVEGAVAQGAPASEYLTKAVERPADLNPEVSVITAQALKDKLAAAGILKVEADSPSAAPVA